MNRAELMQNFLSEMTMRKSEPARLARSARQATYKTCRYCGEMLIQAHKGGLECAAGCIPTSEIDFSGQHKLTDVER